MERVKLGKYLNPIVDFAFKRLFYSEENKELLIDFLNELIEEETLCDLTFLPSIQNEDREKERRAVFDAFCRTDKGELIEIEMQRVKQPNFGNRSLFYASLAVGRQAKKGDWDYSLKRVYVINILDFILFEEEEVKDKPVERVHLKRDNIDTVFDKDNLVFIFVELRKFSKNWKELATKWDKWLFYLRHLPEVDWEPEKETGIFRKLLEAAKVERLTEKEMSTYRKNVLEYADVRAAVNLAKEENLSKGIKEGERRGELRGRLEGLQEGLQKGKLEGKREGLQEASIQTAKNLLSMGMPVDLISKATGLSEEEIKKLK